MYYIHSNRKETYLSARISFTLLNLKIIIRVLNIPYNSQNHTNRYCKFLIRVTYMDKYRESSFEICIVDPNFA